MIDNSDSNLYFINLGPPSVVSIIELKCHSILIRVPMNRSLLLLNDSLIDKYVPWKYQST